LQSDTYLATAYMQYRD